METRATRERLTRGDAEDRYIRAGELEVFRQIQRDALAIDEMPGDELQLAVGPFARLRVDAVVGAVGKTRGAINNVWGSQEGFRAAVMDGFLNDVDLGMDDVVRPDPAAASDVDEWIAALAAAEIARGPRHGMEPQNSYGLRWAAWLGLVPYGIWSERIASPSMDEFRQKIVFYTEEIVGRALEHFELELEDDTSIEQLTAAMLGATEGAWLNACLTNRDPLDGRRRITSSLANSFRMLIRGATNPRTG